MSELVRYYLPETNPNSYFVPGVPLASLTQEAWDELPEHLKRSVDACGFYSQEPPLGMPAEVVEEAEEAEEVQVAEVTEVATEPKKRGK